MTPSWILQLALGLPVGCGFQVSSSPRFLASGSADGPFLDALAKMHASLSSLHAAQPSASEYAVQASRLRELRASINEDEYRSNFWYDTEILARARRRGRLVLGAIPPVVLSGGVSVRFQAVFPVKSSDRDYLVFILPNDDKLWSRTHDAQLECLFEDGTRTPVQKFGAEKDVMYSWVMNWQCDSPAARPQPAAGCRRVQLLQAGVQLFGRSLEVCGEASETVRQEDDGKLHNLTACVPIPYEDGLSPEKSGFVQMPQWMEYNAMHGVDHFVVYVHSGNDARKRNHRARTLEAVAPYLASGRASVVELEGLSVDASWEAYHPLVANDCLYRMRHRTRFLMPTIDTDEYLYVPTHVNFVDALEHYFGPRTHSVSFNRYQFRLPLDGLKTPQIASNLRQPEYARLCPKFVVRPELVRAVFIHWATSWEDNTKALMLKNVWAAHYRLGAAGPEADSKLKVDSRLAVETSELQRRLGLRYGGSWLPASLPVRGPLSLRQTGASEQSLAAARNRAEAWPWIIADQLKDWINSLQNVSNATTGDGESVEISLPEAKVEDIEKIIAEAGPLPLAPSADEAAPSADGAAESVVSPTEVASPSEEAAVPDDEAAPSEAEAAASEAARSNEETSIASEAAAAAEDAAATSEDEAAASEAQAGTRWWNHSIWHTVVEALAPAAAPANETSDAAAAAAEEAAATSDGEVPVPNETAAASGDIASSASDAAPAAEEDASVPAAEGVADTASSEAAPREMVGSAGEEVLKAPVPEDPPAEPTTLADAAAKAAEEAAAALPASDAVA